MTTAIAVLAAAAAACLFGISSVLQQAEASGMRDTPVLRLDLLRRLARRRRWLGAMGLAGISFGAQAVALAFGPIALVQPIAATDLLFALPFLAHRHRRHLGAAGWLGAGLVVAGIAAFLALSPPSAGQPSPSVGRWLPVLAIVTVLVVVVAPAAARARPTLRTGTLAGIAAAEFALVDALTKSVVEELARYGFATFARWEPYALAAGALSGLLMTQSAFRSGSLLISLPIIDTVEPIGAVLIGTTVFGEHIATSPVLLGLQVLAGAAAVCGIVVLDRSPLVGALGAPV